MTTKTDRRSNVEDLRKPEPPRVEPVVENMPSERLAACGYTAAAAAFDLEYQAATTLLEQLISTPATTAEGVCIKVRASRSGPLQIRDRLAASAAADAMRLAYPHADDRRAA